MIVAPMPTTDIGAKIRSFFESCKKKDRKKILGSQTAVLNECKCLSVNLY